MNKSLIVCLAIMLVMACPSFAQVSGNAGYSQSGVKARAEQRERSKRLLSKDELPPSGNSMYVDASVLMNVKADEYVAVFGIAQEGSTVAECSQKMEATIKEFSDALKALGVTGADLFVDFIGQNKIYGFDVQGDIAREKLIGFELKKNVAIHYRDRDLLDRFVVTAARSQVYDLIKVDYIVKNSDKVHDRLMTEAARVIKQKTARYEKLFGVKLRSAPQIYAERPAIHYPTEMYDSYTAYDAEEMNSAALRQRYTTQTARKSRTFFFNGLSGDGFDLVVNPVAVEPVVQFTLYLKVKYEIDRSKGK
jgi:uncharacterized protein YggE